MKHQQTNAPNKANSSTKQASKTITVYLSPNPTGKAPQKENANHSRKNSRTEGLNEPKKVDNSNNDNICSNTKDSLKENPLFVIKECPIEVKLVSDNNQREEKDCSLAEKVKESELLKQ